MGLLALFVPLAFAYLSQKIKSVLGVSPEEATEEVMAGYLATYPIFMVLAAGIATGWLVKGQIDKWRDSVRDEIYLVGEVLHNLDEVER